MKEKLELAINLLHSAFDYELEGEDEMTELFLEEIEQAINHIKSAKEYLIEIES